MEELPYKSESDNSLIIKDSDFYKRSKFNEEIDKEYGKLIKNHTENPEIIAQSILLYVKRYQLTRLLTYYELFKPTIELPGDIVELGVFRGESFLSFAKMLEIFCMGDRTKKIFGFDHFRGLQNFHEKDGNEYLEVDKKKGGWCGSEYYYELKKLIELFDSERFMPLKERAVLIEGDVIDTIPKFVTSNPGMKISLLHFDLDLYEPTKTGLEYLYDHVVSGGIIIFDEYGFHQFSGETKAVDEFFSERKIKPSLKKFSWFSNPGAYMVKE